MWPAIIGAVGSAAGSGGYVSPSKNIQTALEGYTFNRWANADANWENQKAMDKQNEWTEQMSNSAHQREVLDMNKAGLNPILSAGGKGASTPNSASPGEMKGLTPNLTFPRIVASGMGELLQNQQKIDIERANSAAHIEKTAADIDNIGAKKRLAQVQEALVRENLKNKPYETPGLIRTGTEWMKDAAERGTPWPNQIRIRENPNMHPFERRLP